MPRRRAQRRARREIRNLYVAFLKRIVFTTAGDAQEADLRDVMAAMQFATELHKSESEILADLIALARARELHHTIAGHARCQQLMFLTFRLARQASPGGPDEPSLTATLRQIFQDEGAYAALAYLRTCAEEAHKELAALAERHSDLPILKLTPPP